MTSLFKCLVYFRKCHISGHYEKSVEMEELEAELKMIMMEETGSQECGKYQEAVRLVQGGGSSIPQY